MVSSLKPMASVGVLVTSKYTAENASSKHTGGRG